MALQKQNVDINFSQGLETKTDPYQVPLGKFLDLQNSIFNTGGRLTKRNGYGNLPALPDTTSNFVTTFNQGLVATGTDLKSYSAASGQWNTRGYIQPVSVDVFTLIRSNTNQSQLDTAIASNGLICVVYTDQDPTDVADPIYRYAVIDSSSGQFVIEPTDITDADQSYGTPRVFLLGFYFVIVYTTLVTATYHLKYIAISTTNPTSVTSPADISTSYDPSGQVDFDGTVYNNKLFLAWNGASSSGIKVAFLTSMLSVSSSINPDPSHSSTIMSVTADQGMGTIWFTYYDVMSQDAYTFALNENLSSILGVTSVLTNQNIYNLTSSAQDGSLSVVYAYRNSYSYDSAVPSNYIATKSVTQGGSVGSQSVVVRSVSLASKSFIYNETIYFLTAYESPNQSTYFLCDLSGNIIAKLAYGNGGGYVLQNLPSVNLADNIASIGYLFKDLIEPVNKVTGVPAGTPSDGLYSQFGINLASFTFGTSAFQLAETGKNLNFSGGFLWAYDGFAPNEQGFFVYPDSIEVETSTTGGTLTAQTYFYQVIYQWTDSQGNIFRSAPSIPVSVVTTGSTSSNTIHVPTLRLTYKMISPVKICIFRWSTAQQVYYQVTSIQDPLLNDPTVDDIDFLDTEPDSGIIGNSIIYTNGGVLENIGASALDSIFIFDDRLWGISAEDNNLLVYSKQILQATPVEMSDLLSIYVAPNIGAQGSTGSLRCGSQMDDKLILFKDSAINYVSGTGPDNTGANSQYSQPIFITATVGCSNQKSIVFQPQGLMFEFQSEAGNQIWLLGRDLSSQFIGAPVQGLTNNATVQSAVNIPGTNQVRFTLSSGITLMYDYFYGQWGTFTNVPAISSTLFQGLHTFIDQYGRVFQETPGAYLDGSRPVLMSFKTSWIHLAGLQGYQRAYFFTMLGTYYSPHKLNVLVGYDYNPSPSSRALIQPTNFSPAYGNDLTYGSGTPYGGPVQLEQWRVFFQQQRCQSIQLTVNEVYDSSFGVVAGQGLSISGLNLVVGVKKGHRPYRAAHSTGAS